MLRSIHESPITHVKRRCVACQTHQPILGGTLKDKRFRCAKCGPKRAPVMIDHGTQEVIAEQMRAEFPIKDRMDIYR